MFRSNPISRRRALLGLGGAAAAAGAAALVGCGDDDDDGPSGGGSTDTPVTGGTTTAAASVTAAPKSGGTLRGGLINDISLNTGFPYALILIQYLNFAAFEPIIRYTNAVKPTLVLADKYDFSTDLTKLTIQLKADANFHNGAPVTVDDVFFAMDVMLEPSKHNVTGVFQLASFVRWIKERKAIDQKTMELTFDKPRPNISDLFAQLQITPAANYAKLQTAEQVIGTGPFVFKSWTPGQGYRLEANKSWHGAKVWGGPYLDAIDAKIFADRDALGAAFQSGGLDFILGAGAEVAKRAGKDQVKVGGKAGVNYVGTNLKHPLLTDKRVRQALFWAIDRKRIIDEVQEGFGNVTVQPWPETSPAYDKTLDAPFYDPQKAKALLQQAAFQQTDAIPFHIYANTGEKVGSIIQSNFEAIGVKVSLQPTDTNAMAAKLRGREFPGLFLLPHNYADMTPVSLFQSAFPYGPNNPSFYANADYLDVVKQLSTLEPSSAEAKTQYDRFNKIWLDDPWMLPVSPNLRLDVATKNLQGYQSWISVIEQPDFGSMWLKS